MEIMEKIFPPAINIKTKKEYQKGIRPYHGI